MRVGFNFGTLFALITAITVSALALPAYSKADSNKTSFVTIPVYYVTDREMTGETFGAHRRYPTNCQHHMYYGTAYVDVPNTENKTNPELIKSLGWKISDRHTSKISVKDRIDPTNPEQSKKLFSERLKRELDLSAKPEMCLFVHGAADAFEDCCQDAAQLAYVLQKPLVLYSWPSDPKLRGYFIDGMNVEWSQGHFDQFLKDLMALQSEHPLEIISISHSMGNRLVVRALPVVYGKGLVKDWEIVSPDMDADTVRHYTLGLSQLDSKLRLYVSNRDKALPMAQLLSGGYYRLGEAANPTYEANAKWMPGKLFQRIDFTDLDKGLMGHKIPFDLISNMVNSDKPGENLELVDESSVHENRFAKFAGRAEKFNPVSTEASFNKKVVRTNKH